MKTSELISRVAEIKLVYKTRVSPQDRPSIKSSNDAHALFLSYWDNDSIEYIEEFRILLLNRTNKVLGIMDISKGGTSGTVIDVKTIFQSALKANAHNIILAHNHPSGNLKPSQNDINITRKITEAGKFLDICILDHIILIFDAREYYSFADDGMYCQH